MADMKFPTGGTATDVEDVQPGSLQDRVKRIHDVLVGMEPNEALNVLIGAIGTTVAAHLRGRPSEAAATMERVGQKVRAASVDISRLAAINGNPAGNA